MFHVLRLLEITALDFRPTLDHIGQVVYVHANHVDKESLGIAYLSGAGCRRRSIHPADKRIGMGVWKR